jgi:hypothetical protein
MQTACIGTILNYLKINEFLLAFKKRTPYILCNIPQSHNLKKGLKDE